MEKVTTISLCPKALDTNATSNNTVGTDKKFASRLSGVFR